MTRAEEDALDLQALEALKGRAMAYLRKRAGLPPRTVDPAEDRFWAKVDRSGGPDACWPWTGGRTKKGYGRPAGSRADPSTRGTTAHRMAWVYTHGPIPGAPTPGGRGRGRRPDEPMVLHSCDNPPCCNPAHLFIGTNADNMADMARKGRAARTRLSIDDVREIRRRRRNGETCAALGREFGICPSNVTSIALGRSRTHV